MVTYCLAVEYRLYRVDMVTYSVAVEHCLYHVTMVTYCVAVEYCLYSADLLCRYPAFSHVVFPLSVKLVHNVIDGLDLHDLHTPCLYVTIHKVKDTPLLFF